MVPTTTVAEQQQQKFDSYSFSNYMDFEVLDMDLDLSVNFECKKLDGRVHLKIKCLLDSSGEERKDLILDVNKLTVTKVCGCHPNGSGNKMKELQFKIDEQMKFGQALTISLSPDLIEKHSIFHVTIYYSTSPEAPALQWLSSELTLGKKLPFMFSQCQAIHCRSMVPCQDTPSIKSTYTAIIRVKPGFQALMGAQITGVTKNECEHVFEFEQRKPIPAYLIAIAVGDIKSRRIGPRSSVWSEPELLEAAAYEFGEVEKILKTAESIMGPYDWSHYDLLVLPPSFPYGGMENPCLTFVTPTLIAGDRSEISVVAHEITHSWCGNTFTNKSWEHFWLNAGHTRFIEGKIMRKLNGDDYGDLFRYYSYQLLLRTVDHLGATSNLTCLIPDMSDIDPDEAFSQIPYEKGSAFLQSLEAIVGEDRMLEFVRKIVEKYQYRSLDSDDYKNEMVAFFGDTIIDQVHWEDWKSEVGVPQHYQVNVKGQELHQPVVNLAKSWIEGTTISDDGIFSKLISPQIECFLAELIAKAKLIKPETLIKIGETYNFDKYKSCTIRIGWLHLCAKVQYEPSLDKILQFLEVVGRIKYVQPLYSALANWPYARPKLESHFEKHKTSMHPVTAALAQRLLNQPRNSP